MEPLTEEVEEEAGRKGGEAAAPAIVTPAVQPYALNWASLLGAGLAATIVITLMIYFLPPRMDVATALGTFLVARPGPTAFWVGIIWHFINGSVIFMLIYAGALLALRKQSDGISGLWFGALLWFFGPMLILPLMLNLHPLVRTGEMMNPGVFMANAGWAAALWELFDHLVYGGIAGALYRHNVRDRTV